MEPPGKKPKKPSLFREAAFLSGEIITILVFNMARDVL